LLERHGNILKKIVSKKKDMNSPPHLLEKGIREMGRRKIIIAGITRDDNAAFLVMKQFLENLGSHFADVRYVIAENDSKDRTKENLAEWAQSNPKVVIIEKNFGNTKRPSIQFLAEMRNLYLEHQSDLDADILAVVDMDFSRGIDLRGIYHTFAKYSDWDGVCSNGILDDGRHYDLFALEFSGFRNNSANPKYWDEEIFNKQHKIKFINKKNFIPVKSCFAGLAFYKREFLQGCKYASEHPNVCEHRALNNCFARNGGHLFINPKQILHYP